MRCLTCNYPLWNLPERVCPECGTAFKPTDFEFVPSACQFCCRQCMQPYYGTTWRGHLEPIEFACVRCQAHVHMDDTIVLPTAGVSEDRTLQGLNPWIDPNRGAFGKFFSAIGYAMSKPVMMARGTPITASLGRAAVFAMLVNTLAYSICFGPQLLLMLLGPGGGGGGLSNAGAMMGFILISSILGMWVWGLFAHVILKCTGRTAGTLRHTYLALYYAAGANTLSAIPCMGFLCGWVWWMISASIMLKEIQRVGGGRATAAAIVPPLLVVAGLVAFWIYIIAAAVAVAGRTAGGGGGFPGGPTFTPPTSIVMADGRSNAVQVRDVLIARTEANMDRFPQHPAELIAYQLIEPSLVIGGASRSTDTTAKIGGQSLRDLDLLPPGDRLEGFQRAIAVEARDGDAPARRLGDLVLPSLGTLTIDQAREHKLWVLIIAEDPGPALVLPNVIAYWAIRVDGEPVLIGPAEAPRALHLQNAARAEAGLPAIPDPRELEHWKPGS